MERMSGGGFHPPRLPAGASLTRIAHVRRCAPRSRLPYNPQVRPYWLPILLGFGFGALFSLAGDTWVVYVPLPIIIFYVLMFFGLGTVVPFVFLVLRIPPLLGGALCGATAMITYHLLFALTPICYLGTHWTSTTPVASKVVDILIWNWPSVLFGGAVLSVWCWIALSAATAVANRKINVGLNS